MKTIMGQRHVASTLCLLLVLAAGNRLFAQSIKGALTVPASKQAAAATPVDPLGRDTPRNSIINFLEACHDRNFLRASSYLDLRKWTAAQRTANGPRMAEQLAQLLDQDAQFSVSNLSSSPDGNRNDGSSDDLETLNTFHLDGREVLLRLQKVKLPSAAEAWMVSSDSVDEIPQLANLLRESAIEKRLPKAFVSNKILDTSLWRWIALLLLALFLSSLSRHLSRGVIRMLKPVAKRYTQSIHVHRLEEFTEPLRLLLTLIVFRLGMIAIGPSALLRYYLFRLLVLLMLLGLASLAMRIVDVVSDRIMSQFDARQRALSYSVFPLVVRVIKICVFCIAVLIVLAEWGYPTNTILAGLGVGGLAVALAAQKTIENLFGGVSIISDRPVLVGDTCQFGGQVGTVEDIGLRSTRIRTNDRTLVTIPNSVFSTMTLENYSRRDRIWFHPSFQLHRDMSADQILLAMETIAAVLNEHALVDPTDVPVRFTKITQSSFDLDVFSYVMTTDYNVFLRAQNEMLATIVRRLSEQGIEFALPIQQSVLRPLAEGDATSKLTTSSPKLAATAARPLR